MSATNRSGSPSPIIRIKTSIVTFAVREDGDENIINHTKVAHQDVAHLTGLQSNFLEEMVQQPSPGKRPAPSGLQGSQRRSSPRTLPIPMLTSPTTLRAPSPAVPAIPKRTLRMLLTGGTHAKTVDPGAQRPHGMREIMGFVELDFVRLFHRIDSLLVRLLQA